MNMTDGTGGELVKDAQAAVMRNAIDTDSLFLGVLAVVSPNSYNLAVRRLDGKRRGESFSGGKHASNVSRAQVAVQQGTSPRDKQPTIHLDGAPDLPAQSTGCQAASAKTALSRRILEERPYRPSPINVQYAYPLPHREDERTVRQKGQRFCSAGQSHLFDHRPAPPSSLHRGMAAQTVLFPTIATTVLSADLPNSDEHTASSRANLQSHPGTMGKEQPGAKW